MSADCKQAMAMLARYRGDDPQARKLAKAIVTDYRDAILAAWTARLPRFMQERTPLGAWRFHVDLDAAWKRWARSVRRDLGLVVNANVANNRLMLEVGARDREHYFELASTEVGTAPVSELFERAWAALNIPLGDILEANRLLRSPHDIDGVNDWVPAFARPRPPRSAPRERLISWLLSLDRDATMAERAELDAIVIELLGKANARAVAMPRSDDEAAWTRWLVDVDLAITELNRTLKPSANVHVSLEVYRRRVTVLPMVTLRGIDDEDTGVIESSGAVGAVEQLLGQIGAPRDRLKRAATLLARELHDRLGEKLDNIYYLDEDALEAAG